jgi:hypothetical protein
MSRTTDPLKALRQEVAAAKEQVRIWRAERDRLLRDYDALRQQVAMLASGLRAISTSVGIDRTLHLTSCIHYGWRVFDPYTSTCTSECAAARPALDAVWSLS